MNSCRDFESLLSLFAGNDLDIEQRANVAAHLTTCSACRQKVTEYEQITNHLSKLASPTLPETLFADFHEEIRNKITSGEKTQKQMFGIIAVIHAFYRRRRLVIATATLIMMMAVPMLLTRYFHSPQESSSNLTQLLEKRDWMGLYYAMLDSKSRTNFLDEPVAAQLLYSALDELMKVQRQDPKIRLGLQHALSKIKTRDGKSLGLGRSAQILGKITSTGYESAMRLSRTSWDPEISLLALRQIDKNKKMKLRELFLKTNIERNKR